MMDEQEFRVRCDQAMGKLYRQLSEASDTYDFEADQSAGTLTVEFEEPRTKFVVSPNAPVRQIWVSALSKSFKLDWDAVETSFVLPESGATLSELMADVIGKQLGEQVEL
ncbi:MAG TPA: iron donor protein CyaY [Bryobacteraceae bacterium]|nr:iron donor protein CyaY [Bryobacteraceae bacterium]